MACVSDIIEVVQKLLQSGADFSAQDAAGQMPFTEACRHQRETIMVRILTILSMLRYSIALFPFTLAHFKTARPPAQDFVFF